MRLAGVWIFMSLMALMAWAGAYYVRISEERQRRLAVDKMMQDVMVKIPGGEFRFSSVTSSLYSGTQAPIDAEPLECCSEGPGGKNGFPPWSRRIVRRRREIRIRRLGSQTPLWYISRETPTMRNHPDPK